MYNIVLIKQQHSVYESSIYLLAIPFSQIFTKNHSLHGWINKQTLIMKYVINWSTTALDARVNCQPLKKWRSVGNPRRRPDERVSGVVIINLYPAVV